MTDRPKAPPPTAASTDDDPEVYSGRTGREISPYALFLIATFWLAVIGGITLIFSSLWGGIILGIAALTLLAALLTAG